MARPVRLTGPVPSLEEFGKALGISKAKQRSTSPIFVERRADGAYAIRKRGSERASSVFTTQREAIEHAKAIAPDRVYVKRVRAIDSGTMDRWRKA